MSHVLIFVAIGIVIGLPIGYILKTAKNSVLTILKAKAAAIQAEILVLEDDLKNEVSGAKEKLDTKRDELVTVFNMIEQEAKKL